MGAWGVIRGTKDVDIVVDPDPENLLRLGQAAADVGGYVQMQEAFAGSARSLAGVIARGERTLVTTELGPLDVVQGLPGVPAYAELASRAQTVDLDGVRLQICSLADLRSMKRAAARPQDVLDLESLEAAHGPDSA